MNCKALLFVVLFACAAVVSDGATFSKGAKKTLLGGTAKEAIQPSRAERAEHILRSAGAAIVKTAPKAGPKLEGTNIDKTDKIQYVASPGAVKLAKFVGKLKDEHHNPAQAYLLTAANENMWGTPDMPVTGHADPAEGGPISAGFGKEISEIHGTLHLYWFVQSLDAEKLGKATAIATVARRTILTDTVGADVTAEAAAAAKTRIYALHHLQGKTALQFKFGPPYRALTRIPMSLAPGVRRPVEDWHTYDMTAWYKAVPGLAHAPADALDHHLAGHAKGAGAGAGAGAAAAAGGGKKP